MDILKHVDGNIAGINPVQYIFQEDLLSFAVNSSTLIATIGLKPGRAWNCLYATNETISLEGKEDITPSGVRYTYTIKMLVPKDRSNVEAILYSLNNRYLVILLTDKNGVSRYFGTDQCPMVKSAKLTKPQNVEGFNGWELVFVGEFTMPAAYAATTNIPVYGDGSDPGIVIT